MPDALLTWFTSDGAIVSSVLGFVIGVGLASFISNRAHGDRTGLRSVIPAATFAGISLVVGIGALLVAVRAIDPAVFLGASAGLFGLFALGAFLTAASTLLSLFQGRLSNQPSTK